jgi:hypothetical protein
MSKNLNEEIIRMRQIFNFKISDNAHDILSEEVIKKSLITEQKVSLQGLADEAKEKDSEIVQSTPGYEETIDWWSRGGPTKGKSFQEKSVSAKSLQYWNGDLSAKMTGSRYTAPVERIGKLTNEKNVKKIIKKIQSIASDYTKKYPTGKKKVEVLDYDVATIVKAATQIQNALNELRKNGNYIGAEHENGNIYNVYGGAAKGKYPHRLNILPFGPNDGNYVGKILSHHIPYFNHWYKQLSNVGDIIEIINNQEYWGKGEGKSFTVISDKDKIGLLQAFTAKAAKSERNTISNAVSLKIGPKGAKWGEWEDDIVYKQDATPMGGYPKDGLKQKFFKDDSIEVNPEISNGFYSWLRGHILLVKQEGGIIRQVDIWLFASTSAVPSSAYDSNETLVAKRVEEMEKVVNGAVAAADVDTSLIEFHTSNDQGSTVIPNNPNCEPWGKKEQLKYRTSVYRNKPENATIKAEYEEDYKDCRYASFGVLIQYDIPEEKDKTTSFTKVGSWKESITWAAHGGGGGRSGRIPKPPKMYKFKGDPYSCPTWSSKWFIPGSLKGKVKGSNKKYDTNFGKNTL